MRILLFSFPNFTFSLQCASNSSSLPIMSEKILAHIHPDYRPIVEILSPEIPAFFEPFFDSPALLRLKGIGQNCGTEFGNFHHYLVNFSRLDHSLGVGLIAWKFSREPKIALAGLFHDMGHTVFSHVGDYLFGDSEKQETAEKGIGGIIRNDAVIMRELAKIGLTPEDVEDYTRYPITDNPGPKLSADRLEYTLSAGYMLRYKSMEDLRRMFENIQTFSGENEGLAFSDPELALEFAKLALKNDETCFACYEESAMMNFFAAILARLVSLGKLTHAELYTLSDAEVISRIEHSCDEKLIEMWKFYRTFDSYKVLRYPKKTGKFTVSSKIKRRHIDPVILREGFDPVRVSQMFPDFAEARNYHLSRKEEWVVINYPEFRSEYL